MIFLMFFFDDPHPLPFFQKILLAPEFLVMSVIIVLVIISVIVAGSFLAAFIWSVKKGQYDDDYTPSVRMLFDDQIPENKTSK